MENEFKSNLLLKAYLNKITKEKSCSKELLEELNNYSYEIRSKNLKIIVSNLIIF